MKEKRQEILQQAAINHRESLRRSLQQRLEAARARGDQRLIGQLEAEASYLRIN
jgi:hypothetical protein